MIPLVEHDLILFSNVTCPVACLSKILARLLHSHTLVSALRGTLAQGWSNIYGHHEPSTGKSAFVNITLSAA